MRMYVHTYYIFLCFFLDAKFVKDGSKLCNLASHPSFQGVRILHESLTLVYLRSKIARFFRPYACGTIILDIAKELMYSQYYRFWVPLFGRKNIRIMMTDTDSFLLHVTNLKEDLEDLLLRHKEKFDFSNMMPGSKLYDTSNRMKVGLWKIEFGTKSNYGGETKEVVTAKSKVYALQCVHMSEAYLRNKGVPEKAQMSQMVEIIQEPDKVVKSSYVEISRRDFLLTTQSTTKTAVSALNDKFWYHRCLLHCKPIGYPDFTLDCDVCDVDNLSKQEEYLQCQSDDDEELEEEELEEEELELELEEDDGEDDNDDSNKHMNVLNLGRHPRDNFDDIFYGHEADLNDENYVWIRK